MEIKPILSICIATTSARSEVIKPLLASLQRQMVPEVELIINAHETDCIGKKRQDMLKMCRGEWVAMQDSDDEISENYVQLVLKALESNPDSVGINGIITTNGRDKRQWYISKEYGEWFTGADGIYYRTPNHISPIRTSLALKAGFQPVSFAEDHLFSMAVLPYLRTETIINEPIYHYRYRNDEHK